MKRYAIYIAPERDTRLWHFGNRVLGRDVETGALVPQIVPDGFQPDDWQSFTASPRRYGFHATMKPPFRLKHGTSERELFDAARSFANSREPVRGLRLAPAPIGDYIMLTLPEPDPQVRALADACVADFDGFRAPLTDEERRRRGSGLTGRQSEYLENWGYPHVFEDFTFHITLAGPLPKDRIGDALRALTAAYEQAVKDELLTIRSVCIFAEPEDGPFRLALRLPLGSG